MTDRSESKTVSAGRSSTGEPPVDERERDEVAEEVRATLGALMPWGISILAHVALVALAFFLVWQTLTPQPEEEPVFTKTGLTPSPGAPVDFVKEEVKQQDQGAPRTQPNDPDVTFNKPNFVGPNQIVAPFHKERQQGTGGLKNGPGKGMTPGDLFENGEPGDPNATKFVYIIDASGSMVDVLPFVISDLKRAISGLSAKHHATVLIFSGKGVYEVPGGKGMRSMTPAFRQRVLDWVTLDNHRYDVGGRGTAFVEQALAKGLGYGPQVVHLLSDNLTGGGQGATRHELMQDEVIALIKKRNKAVPPAKINTYQFLYEDPLIRAGLTGTLQLIAQKTGGRYKFISESKLSMR